MEKKEIIGQRIRELRLKNGYEQMDIALKLGYKSDTTISKWESGASLPTGKKLPLLALMLNTSTDYILFGETPTTPPDAKNDTIQAINDTAVQLHPERQENVLEYATEQLEEQKKTTREIQEEPAEYNSDKIVSFDEYRKKVPEIVDFAASAGTGVCQEDNLGMEVMFYEDELAEDYDSIGIVMGSSMEPVLKNGDYIFVKVTTDIPNGAISIWQVNGENYVKKFRNNRRPYLESLNPEYDDIDLDEDDNIRPLGVVVDVYREG